MTTENNDNLSESARPNESAPPKLLTRAECSKILESRGYVKGDYPGTWVAPNGEKLAWFGAVTREGLKFDKKDKPWAEVKRASDNQPFQ